MRQLGDDKFAIVDGGVVRVVRTLVAWESEVRGITQKAARQIVAREARVAPGSLERLSAGRLKFTDRIAGRLNELLVKKIERKMAELEHELALARLACRRASPIDVERAEAALEEARRALGKG